MITLHMSGWGVSVKCIKICFRAKMRCNLDHAFVIHDWGRALQICVTIKFIMITVSLTLMCIPCCHHGNFGNLYQTVLNFGQKSTQLPLHISHSRNKQTNEQTNKQTNIKGLQSRRKKFPLQIQKQILSQESNFWLSDNQTNKSHTENPHIF